MKGVNIGVFDPETDTLEDKLIQLALLASLAQLVEYSDTLAVKEAISNLLKLMSDKMLVYRRSSKNCKLVTNIFERCSELRSIEPLFSALNILKAKNTQQIEDSKKMKNYKIISETIVLLGNHLIFNSLTNSASSEVKKYERKAREMFEFEPENKPRKEQFNHFKTHFSNLVSLFLLKVSQGLDEAKYAKQDDYLCFAREEKSNSQQVLKIYLDFNNRKPIKMAANKEIKIISPYISPQSSLNIVEESKPKKYSDSNAYMSPLFTPQLTPHQSKEKKNKIAHMLSDEYNNSKVKKLKNTACTNEK